MVMKPEATSRETIAPPVPGVRLAVLVAIMALAIAYLGLSFQGQLPGETPHSATAITQGQQPQHLAARDTHGRAFTVAARPDPRMPPPPGLILSAAGWTVPTTVIAAPFVPSMPVHGLYDRPRRANPPRAPPCLTV